MSDGCIDSAIGARLAAYEFGQLPEAERIEFEAHARECPHCAEELWATSPWATAATEAPGEVLDRLRETGGGVAAGRAATPDKRPGPLDLLRAWWSGRAKVLVPAAALAGLTIMMLHDLSPTGTAGLARLEPLPWVPVELRAGVTNDAVRFRDAMETYSKGRYREAVVALAPLTGSHELTSTEREQAELYLGVSHLLGRDPDAAIDVLTSVSGSTLPIVADRATWYLAQAHLVRNEGARAEPLLARLAEASPAYRQAARDLLDQLPELPAD